METIKIWSKWKLSKVSKFSISSIGQNQKLGNLGIGHFFFSNHIIKLTFFFSGLIFQSVFYILSFIYYQKFKEKKSFRDFWVFDFRYRAKSKTWKSRKLALFLLKPYDKVNVFYFGLFFNQFLDFEFHILPKI